MEKSTKTLGLNPLKAVLGHSQQSNQFICRTHTCSWYHFCCMFQATAFGGAQDRSTYMCMCHSPSLWGSSRQFNLHVHVSLPKPMGELKTGQPTCACVTPQAYWGAQDRSTYMCMCHSPSLWGSSRQVNLHVHVSLPKRQGTISH